MYKTLLGRLKITLAWSIQSTIFAYFLIILIHASQTLWNSKLSVNYFLRYPKSLRIYHSNFIYKLKLKCIEKTGYLNGLHNSWRIQKTFLIARECSDWQCSCSKILSLFYRKGETDSDSNHGSHGPHDPAKAQQEQHQQFLGDASAALPNFGDIDTSVPFPEGITIDHIRSFEKMYREHAEAIVDVVVNLQFSLIEALWQGFWRNQPPDQLTYVWIVALSIYCVNICLLIRAVNSINMKIILHYLLVCRADNDYEKRLPKEKLYMVSSYEPLQQWVRKADYTFYQALVEVLIPDVLRPIPSKFLKCLLWRNCTNVLKLHVPRDE